MSIEVTKMEDITKNSFKLIMLYGDSGSGKTSVACSGTMKKLLVDLESGSGRAISNDFTEVWRPTSLVEFMNGLTADNVKDYDAIVIDTLGRFISGLVYKYSNSDGVPNQDTWSSVKREAQKWWSRVVSLRKHIILIAHGKYEKEVRYVPEIAGKSPELIVRDLDYVGVVRDGAVLFKVPESWCKNTRGVMPDELSLDLLNGGSNVSGFLDKVVLANAEQVVVDDCDLSTEE